MEILVKYVAGVIVLLACILSIAILFGCNGSNDPEQNCPAPTYAPKG